MKRLFLAVVLAAGFTGLTAAAGEAFSSESFEGGKDGKKGGKKGKKGKKGKVPGKAPGGKGKDAAEEELLD